MSFLTLATILCCAGILARWVVQLYYDRKTAYFDQPDGVGMSKDPDVLKEKDRVDGLMAGKPNTGMILVYSRWF